MRKILLPLISVLLLASCSTPKYTYYFDHYDYNSGKKKNADQKALAMQINASAEETSPLSLTEQSLTASADSKVVLSENKTAPVIDKNAFAKKYSAMSKAERKEFKKELKEEIKNYSKTIKKGDFRAAADKTKVMDHDLKMAIIFGAIGLVLSLLGGANSIFWVLSVIAIVIGVVFLVMWLSRQ
jgi:hypothetical protein